MKLSPEHSLAGILEPVFAIRTEDDLGIGDIDGLRQMVDWCHRHGLHILQTLPINETSDDNSPYNAISSLAIEPTTIALKLVPGFDGGEVQGDGDGGTSRGVAGGAGAIRAGQGAEAGVAGGGV